MTVLDLESVTSRIVVRKLGFLKRQLAVGAVGVAAIAMRSLLDNPNSLCLVGEYRELDEHFGTNYTDAILEGGDEVSMQEVKRVVNQADTVSKLDSWGYGQRRELGQTCTTSRYTAYRWAQGPLKDAGTSRSWIKAVSSL